jgi:hypothetical protein
MVAPWDPGGVGIGRSGIEGMRGRVQVRAGGGPVVLTSFIPLDSFRRSWETPAPGSHVPGSTALEPGSIRIFTKAKEWLMQRAIWIPLIVVSMLIAAGCGDSSGPDRSAQSAVDSRDAGTSADTGAGRAAGAGGSPSETVARFYEALRSGEDRAIAALLTDKARAETANNGLDIQSQGSAQLEYQLGEVDYINDSMDGAHVKSLWIDYTPDGEKTATEVIWVLRKQAEGWRIAGMATQVVEGQLPLLFNFEDPEDMLRKKEYVENQYRLAEEAMEAQAATADDPLPPESIYR